MRKTFLFPAILVGALAMLATAHANPSHRDHGGEFHGKSFHGEGFRGGPMGGAPEIGKVLHMARRLEAVAEEIGLSDEQRDAIHAVIDEARPQLRDLGRDMRATRDALEDASAPGSYDPGAVSTLASAQGELVSRGIVLGLQVRHDVLGVLTPEQREQLQSMREERRRHRH